MITGTVFDIRRYSIHDGPGIRTAVFFKGCPLGCAWCHNPESRAQAPELMFRANRCILCDDCLGVCPNEAIRREGDEIRIDRGRCRVSGNCAAACPAEALEIVGREMTSGQVLREIERDRAFHEQSGGGATFTGGEPLAQPEFLRALLEGCRERGVHTAVDTCGHAAWEVMEGVRPLVDLFLYDLKLMDGERHERWTGVSNRLILSNLRALSQAGSHIRVRMPLIPGINDDDQNLRAAGKFLAALAKVPEVELLPYHRIALGKYAGLGREYALADLQPPLAEKVKASAMILGEYGLTLVTEGRSHA